MDEQQRTFRVYPINKVDVFAEVMSQLERMIAEMEKGERLPSERDLGSQLGASRVILREALRALEGMGRIEIRPHLGSYVIDPRGHVIANHLRQLAPLDENTLTHLVDVRAGIEDRIVRNVASLPSTELEPIGALLDRVDGELANETLEPGSLDLRFEAALGRVCGNPLLTELQINIHELWVQTWSACGIAPGSHEDLHGEHRQIFGALEKGDGVLARGLMQDHIDRVIDLSSLDQRVED